MNDGTQSTNRDGADGGQTRVVVRRRRSRTPRRLALSCLKLSALVVVLAVVAAGVLVARLSLGPVAIDGIGDKIEAALHQRFGKGLRFALGETAIVQHGFGPSLSIDKLSISGPDGNALLTAPKAEISVDPFSLMVGRVVPKRLEVFDVTLRLVMLANGNLALAAGDGSKPFFEFGRNGDAGAAAAAAPSPAIPAAPASAGPTRNAAMKQAAEGIRQLLDVLTNPNSAIAAVDRLGIQRGTLVIQDQATGEETTYKGLELGFDRRDGKTSFDLAADGPSRRWSIDALVSGVPHAERHFSLKAKDLSIDELELALGSRSIGFDSDMPFEGQVDIGLNADDTLSEATGDFGLAGGFLRTDDPDQEPLLIKSLDGGVRWNGAARKIEITRLHYLDDGGSELAGAGAVNAPRNDGDPWRIDLAMTQPGVLAPDRKGQEPVAITNGAFHGRLQPDQKRFLVDAISFKTGGTGGMAVAGQVDWQNGPRLRFGASLSDSPIATVKRIWPETIAAPVRAWMMTHFVEGTIRNATLKLDYDETALKRMRADRAPADAAISLDFDVAKGKVVFLDGVPPLENVIGSAHVTGRTSRFDVKSGTIDANGKNISLTDGVFAVANANQHPIKAKAIAHLSGTVEAVADVLSRDALKHIAQLPLDPSTLHGHVDGMLDKTIYLGTTDDASDVLKVDAKVTDFTAEHLVGKANLDNATVDVAVDSGKLKATGQGRVYGAPATFEIDRDGFGTPNAMIAVTLDDAARAKLGMSAIQGLSGPVVAHVNAALGDPAKMKAQVDLDLSRASVAAAYIGLTKPAGRPGRIAFTLAPGPNRMIVDPVIADIGPLQARGTIDLAPDNSFQAAHFSTMKLSPGDDMKVDVAKGDDAFKLTIRGSTIDARPFLKAVTSTPTNDSSQLARSAKAEKREVDSFKGFDIDLKSGLLTGFNKEVMSGVELKLSKRDSAFRQFAVKGRFGSHAVNAAMNANGKVKLSTDDAGALVSFIDLYKHMEGGLLTSSLQFDEDELSGNLEIHEFVLRDEPAIERLVAQSTEVSAPGADAEAARRINAGAVRFHRLKVSFDRQGSQLELHDANMSGPEIGLSVDGWLDYSHDKVDMKGTFVPAFALNNLFSQIPVFGVFLGGKSNEGLLAITFRITGLASTPTLSINPLSVVAPGILRNIFGALDDAAYSQQQNGRGAPSH